MNICKYPEKKRIIGLYFKQHKTYAETEIMSPNDITAATIWKEEARNQKYQYQQLLEDLSSDASNLF
jgi:hypothetical protein